MATKTISLTEGAYERLCEARREGESFTDVVRRLTPGVRLSSFHGAPSEETADGLEAAEEATRRERNG